MGPLPTFLMVGTAKSGTSSLATYLDGHPSVCFARVQEPNFFAFDRQYERGLDYYRSLYAHHAGEPCLGEKSWRYSCAGTYPAALDRIGAALPDIKIVYVVRDPVPRALSMWREMRDAGQDNLPGDPNAALSDPQGIIVDSTHYAHQLALFEMRYGRQNTLVLFFEDFTRDPKSVQDRLCDFLGIPQYHPDQPIHENRSKGQRSDGHLLEWMRRTGLDRAARALSPDPLRTAARTVLKRPITRVEITRTTRTQFLGYIANDCRALLAREGRDASLWSLE